MISTEASRKASILADGALCEHSTREPAVCASEAGRYDVYQIDRDPLPSGHTSRRSGVAIKRQYGSVVVERDPWDE
jgi:hypothetical protein